MFMISTTDPGLQATVESLTAELVALRRALRAEMNALETENAEQERKSSAFWHAAWKERNRQHAIDKLRIAQLEAMVEQLRCGDLVAFHDGELDEGRHEAFQGHLAHCKGCQEGLLSLAQMEGRFSELAPPPRTPRGG